MMTRLSLAAAVLTAVVAASGCLDLQHKSSLAGPTQLNDLKALVGTWSSSAALPSAQSCSDFRWEITEQTGNSASGSFSATCPGGLKVAGTARGTMLGSTISFAANATATVTGLPSCAITLNGTAYLETDRIRVPYSGQTCLGPVQGEEILKRN